MLSAVIAARGRKYLMMNAPATQLAEIEALLPALESPTVIPLAHDGHDRDPLGRRRRRRLGPAAAAQGRRRVGHPRPADREDRPVTPRHPTRAAGTAPDAPFRLRRLDLAAVAAGDPAARPRATTRSSAAAPSPTPAVREPARADPRRRPRRAATPPSARPTPRSAAAGPTAAWSSTPPSCATARDRLAPRDPPRPRPGDRQRPPLRRDPATASRPGRRSRPASRSSAAGRRWRASAPTCPGGSAPYPSSLVMTVVPAQVAGVGAVVVASPGRPRRARPTRSCSARPACSRSMRSSSPAAPRRSARSRTACPEAGVEPVDRIVGPGNAWVTAAKIEVCGEVGIDLPAGPSEGMVLAAPPADPRARRRRPHHPGRARPGLAGHPRDHRRRLRRRRRGRGRRGPARARDAARHPRRRPSRDHGRIVLAPTLDAAIDFVNAYGPSTSRSTSSRSSRPSRGCATRARCSSGPWAPESAGDYATGANHVLPTGGLARGVGRRSRSRPTASSSRSSGSPATGLAGIRETIAHAGRGRGPARPPRRRRDPLRGTDDR